MAWFRFHYIYVTNQLSYTILHQHKGLNLHIKIYELMQN
jgi:hypothetical protein